MKISGFTFVKNATKLFFPVKESIESVLPIVDEFIVLLAEGDPDDLTREEISNIKSPKIKIIPSEWPKDNFPHNTVYAHETDKAKAHCTGDWLFYLQTDEVVHEKFLKTIYAACTHYLHDEQVEGLLFEYKHFWGDFNHYFQAHSWYPREIRIIRNRDDIHSWRDAQSFRVIETFNNNYESYLNKSGTRKLNVARIFCDIYHYGWVRPPGIMTTKTKRTDPGLGSKLTDKKFDYGPLDKLVYYQDSHPEVLKPWIEKIFNWQDELQMTGKRRQDRLPYKHERFKYKLLSYLEYRFLGGRQIGGFKNYRIIREFKAHENSG